MISVNTPPHTLRSMYTSGLHKKVDRIRMGTDVHLRSAELPENTERFDSPTVKW